MSLKKVKSMREYLDFLDKEGELLTIKGEVDPIVQMSAIGKKLDGGIDGQGFLLSGRVYRGLGLDHGQVFFQRGRAGQGFIQPRAVRRGAGAAV